MDTPERTRLEEARSLLKNRGLLRKDLYLFGRKGEEAVELLAQHGLWPDAWVGETSEIVFIDDTEWPEQPSWAPKKSDALLAVASDLPNLLAALQILDSLKPMIRKKIDTAKPGTQWIDFDRPGFTRLTREIRNRTIGTFIAGENQYTNVFALPDFLPYQRYAFNQYIWKLEKSPFQEVRDIVKLGYVPVVSHVESRTARGKFYATLVLMYPTDGL